MADYDFHKLSWLDFETLCSEVLTCRDGVMYHHFREGRDGGVDILRGNMVEGIVYQCKRYADFKSLWKVLQDEVEKVKKLNPKAYGVMTSAKLLPQEKRQIRELFDPYIKTEDAVIDGNDLNDLLEHDGCRKVVHHFPALWLGGFHVLSRSVNNDIIGRSDSEANRMATEMKNNWAWTDVASRALSRLEKTRVIVLTGDPGIGKTVTAEMLLVQSVNVGYEPFVTFKKIEDFERVYDENAKQVFYFDDFIGHSYLDATLIREDSQVVAFIKRVLQDENKRFILTSRTKIINDGLAVSGSYKYFWRIDPPYLFRMPDYGVYDKAKILYQNMMQSVLPTDRINQIFENRAYWQIVRHRNFNARVVNTLLQNRTRRELRKNENLVRYMIEALDSPEEVWADLYDQGLNSGEKMLLWSICLCPRIPAEDLRLAYNRYLRITRDASSCLRFDLAIERLAGSMVAQLHGTSGAISYELLNPSVEDFLIGRCSGDVMWAGEVLAALNSYRAFSKFREMVSKAHTDRAEMSLAYEMIDERLNFLESPDLAVAVWRGMLETKSVKGMESVLRVLGEFDIESIELNSSDDLAEVLWNLDQKGVDLRTKVGLKFETDVVDAWVQEAKSFNSLAHLYHLFFKYDAEEAPNLMTAFENTMGDLAFEMTSDLTAPDYETDDEGRNFIPDHELEYLDSELRDKIKEACEKCNAPLELVDVDACMQNIDLADIFSPPQSSYVDDDDALRYRRQVDDEEERVDRLFSRS